MSATSTVKIYPSWLNELIQVKHDPELAKLITCDRYHSSAGKAVLYIKQPKTASDVINLLTRKFLEYCNSYREKHHEDPPNIAKLLDFSAIEFHPDPKLGQGLSQPSVSIQSSVSVPTQEELRQQQEERERQQKEWRQQFYQEAKVNWQESTRETSAIQYYPLQRTPSANPALDQKEKQIRQMVAGNVFLSYSQLRAREIMPDQSISRAKKGYSILLGMSSFLYLLAVVTTFIKTPFRWLKNIFSFIPGVEWIGSKMVSKKKGDSTSAAKAPSPANAVMGTGVAAATLTEIWANYRITWKEVVNVVALRQRILEGRDAANSPASNSDRKSKMANAVATNYVESSTILLTDVNFGLQPLLKPSKWTTMVSGAVAGIAASSAMYAEGQIAPFSQSIPQLEQIAKDRAEVRDYRSAKSGASAGGATSPSGFPKSKDELSECLRNDYQTMRNAGVKKSVITGTTFGTGVAALTMSIPGWIGLAALASGPVGWVIFGLGLIAGGLAGIVVTKMAYNDQRTKLDRTIEEHRTRLANKGVKISPIALAEPVGRVGKGLEAAYEREKAAKAEEARKKAEAAQSAPEKKGWFSRTLEKVSSYVKRIFASPSATVIGMSAMGPITSPPMPVDTKDKKPYEIGVGGVSEPIAALTMAVAGVVALPFNGYYSYKATKADLDAKALVAGVENGAVQIAPTQEAETIRALGRGAPPPPPSHAPSPAVRSRSRPPASSSGITPPLSGAAGSAEADPGEPTPDGARRAVS